MQVVGINATLVRESRCGTRGLVVSPLCSLRCYIILHLQHIPVSTASPVLHALVYHRPDDKSPRIAGYEDTCLLSRSPTRRLRARKYRPFYQADSTFCTQAVTVC